MRPPVSSIRTVHHYGVGSGEFQKKGSVMRMKQKLAVAAMAVAALIGGIAATAATATSATAATSTTAATASCGWETIYSASDSSGGTVELQYDTCDRYVRAYAHGLPDNYSCYKGINVHCAGWVSKVRVYNETTGAVAGSGVIDQSSFTTGAIDDAGDLSHACMQNGFEAVDGSISWQALVCTGSY
jgi:hypothetical protein